MVTEPDAAAAYHELLLRTSRIGMCALVFLCAVETVAYAPWAQGDAAPFPIELISAGPMLWVWSSAWAVAGVWSGVVAVRGKGAAALLVALLCTAWAAGFWIAWGWSVFVINSLESRDYLGGALYTVLAVLLFTGRTLARGLLVQTTPPQCEAGGVL